MALLPGVQRGGRRPRVALGGGPVEARADARGGARHASVDLRQAVEEAQGPALRRRHAEEPAWRSSRSNIDPASARAAETHMRLLAKRLAVVVEQIAETDGRIDAFLAELGGADPAPAADGDAQPGQIEEQRDATILRTIPGVGRIVLARA